MLSLRLVHHRDSKPAHDLAHRRVIRERVALPTRAQMVFELLDLGSADEQRRHEQLLTGRAPHGEQLPSSLRHSWDSCVPMMMPACARTRRRYEDGDTPSAFAGSADGKVLADDDAKLPLIDLETWATKPFAL